MATNGDDDHIIKAPGTVPTASCTFALVILSTTPLMPIVQILKLRHGEVKSLIPGHIDRRSR